MNAFFRELLHHALVVDDVSVCIDGTVLLGALLSHLDRAAHSEAETAIFCEKNLHIISCLHA